jgi:EAL and modified HD-GYP domain-containing signal transduction protein
MQTEVFVARQPIMNRRGMTVGQELLFRDARTEAARISDGFSSTAAVVERVLGTFGLEQILDSCDGFLNCTDQFLWSGLTDVLPASRFVLELLENTELTPELGARCDTLRDAGFRVAMDDVRSLTPSLERFLCHVDIVKLDWPYIAAKRRDDMVASFRRAGKHVLAEKVEERDEQTAAMLSGCDLFQGFYFCRPQVLAARRITPSVGVVFRMIQLLMDGAGSAHLEHALKSSPALVVQLLRLSNSASCFTSSDGFIVSIRQALAVVGTRQLLLWCSLLLYGNSSGSLQLVDPLVQLVERRAGFMERAAMQLNPGDESFCQAAWLTGLLSLAHVPHGMSVDAFISELPVSASIRHAIIAYYGELGALLRIAECLERGDFAMASVLAKASHPGLVATLPGLTL